MKEKVNPSNNNKVVSRTKQAEFKDIDREYIPGLKLIAIHEENIEPILISRFSNHGHRIAYISGDSVWVVHDNHSKPELVYRAAISSIRNLAWSVNDEFLAVADDDVISIIDLTTNIRINRLIDHKSLITDLIFLSDDHTLISTSTDRTVRSWQFRDSDRSKILIKFQDIVTSIALSPDKTQLSAVSETHELIIYDFLVNGITESHLMSGYENLPTLLTRTGNLHIRTTSNEFIINEFTQEDVMEININAHNSLINGITCSPDGRIIVTKSMDGTVKFWEIDSWRCILSLYEETVNQVPNVIDFSTDGKYLITRANKNSSLRIWEIDSNKFLQNGHFFSQVRYTTAKIVLVGDSGVGKTGLGWRLSQGFFKEHESTHGQQFWIVDDLSLKRNDGTECEAVLWDLAGQPDYRLVHSLFLDRVDLALILFDSTIRENPLSSAIFWLNQLQMNREKTCPSILIGSRTDRGTSTLTVKELEAFASQNGFTGGYLATSAHSGDGVPALLDRIKTLIPWENFSMTITTQTFKVIKDYILARKANTDHTSILMTYKQLSSAISLHTGEMELDHDELFSAVRHLENHGYISVIESSRQETFILLVPDLIINLASSLILEARKNIRGLGVLEENKLLGGGYQFPEVKLLSSTEQKIILDATISLFIKNAICFRESFNDESFFVFPSLINEKKPSRPDESITEGTSYIVTGAIENVYPSLVVLLGYTNTFKRHNQWQNQAEYQIGENEICGFRQRSDKQSEVEFILYHIDNIPEYSKQLFQSLFERFLIRRDIHIRRYIPVVCDKCNEQVQRSVVIDRLSKQKDFAHCNECGRKISLKNAVETLSFNEYNRKVDDQKKVADRRTIFETSLIKLKNLFTVEIMQTPPKCFICYAWGTEANERWVQRFAKDLKSAGIDVLLDRWHNLPGSSISQYVDRIMKCDFVVPVGTKLLKTKYESTDTDSVVKAEQLLINTRITRRSKFGNTVIPVLLEGLQEESFTPFLQDLVFIDFTKEQYYFVNLMKLTGQLLGLSENEDFLQICMMLEAEHVFGVE